MNLEEAVEKIRYANLLYHSLPLKRQKKKVVDNKTSLELEDPSGLYKVVYICHPFRGDRTGPRARTRPRAPARRGRDVGLRRRRERRHGRRDRGGAEVGRPRLPDRRGLALVTGRTGAHGSRPHGIALTQAASSPVITYVEVRPDPNVIPEMPFVPLEGTNGHREQLWLDGG